MLLLPTVPFQANSSGLRQHVQFTEPTEPLKQQNEAGKPSSHVILHSYIVCTCQSAARKRGQPALFRGALLDHLCIPHAFHGPDPGLSSQLFFFPFRYATVETRSPKRNGPACTAPKIRADLS